jgi:hypothetical protein
MVMKLLLTKDIGDLMLVLLIFINALMMQPVLRTVILVVLLDMVVIYANHVYKLIVCGIYKRD